jgi:8-oxo-dGTP diphosphatase
VSETKPAGWGEADRLNDEYVAEYLQEHRQATAPSGTIEYVVGLLFSEDRESVALVHKNRPEWQAGKWNGVGGKVELGERVEEAMRREFLEEAGVSLPSREWLVRWRQFATISGSEKTPGEVTFQVHYFLCFSDAILNLETCTDEPVGLWPVDGLPETVTNLRWLVQMALSMEKERAWRFEIQEVV